MTATRKELWQSIVTATIVAIGAAVLLTTLLLSGCLTAGPNPEDPYEEFNRQMYAFNEGLDKAIIEPVAHGYRAVTNEPVREGVSNFVSNLGEPLTFTNQILQEKSPTPPEPPAVS